MMFSAIEFFGQEIPNLGFALLAFALIAIFFLVNRSSAKDTNRQGGTGVFQECKRCGARFQPERMELMSSGNVRRWIDDNCPKCGWDLDWADPDNPRP